MPFLFFVHVFNKTKDPTTSKMMNKSNWTGHWAYYNFTIFWY